MVEPCTSVREDFDGVSAEREQLERDLELVRLREEALVVRALEEHVLPRLRETAIDLGFAIEGRRSRGLALEPPRDPSARRLFVLHDDDTTWKLIERHAHGLSAVVTTIPVRALIDAFGRSAVAVLLKAAAAGEETASARWGTRDGERGSVKSATGLAAAASRGGAVRAGVNGAGALRAVAVRRNTLECPHCDARPNAENLPRHLQAIHGVEPGGRLSRRPSRSAHEHCRLCDARLPAGRLDAHLTARHGVFRVHPQSANVGAGASSVASARAESRRAAAARFARAPRGQLESVMRARRDTIAGVSGESGAARGGASARSASPERSDLLGSLVHAPAAGRDFLKETRTERALVARAESPQHNRDRAGRFSDAPDVERMDGESDA